LAAEGGRQQQLTLKGKESLKHNQDTQVSELVKLIVLANKVHCGNRK